MTTLNSPYNRRCFLKRALLTSAAVSLASHRLSATTHSSGSPALTASSVHLNVVDFGAKGDGATLDTTSLQRALDRCNVLGGGEVLVPAGLYLTGTISIGSKVTLRLAEGAVLLGSPNLSDYTQGAVRWEGKWIPGYTALVHALDANSIAVVGKGRIEGNVAVSGRPTKDNPLRRPALLEFINCQGVHLEDFSTSYIHMWSIHPTCCDDVVIRNLTVRSTETNGDGIDIDSCRRVLIEGCDIASGDDCISLKSGRGEEAFLMNRPTEDVHITNCTFEGRGYSCIGIGSESSAGIRNVLIEHCHVKSVYKNAIYIKSRVGRGAFIENIIFRDIDATNMRSGFLSINQTGAGTQDANPVPGLDGVPLFRNFRFENIRVHDAPVLVNATAIDPNKVLDGLVLDRISGTCAKGITLANAKGVVIRNLNLSGYAGPLLRIANVEGRGLKGAAEFPTPESPALVPQPQTPYLLH